MAKNKRTLIMKSKGAYPFTQPGDELDAAFKELSANAFRLLVYYYSKFNGWNFDDKEIAKTLGIKVRTLQTNRKELIDKGYLLIFKGPIDNYFVGKQQVREFQDAAKTSPSTSGAAAVSTGTP